jgi:hypothetical protein
MCWCCCLLLLLLLLQTAIAVAATTQLKHTGETHSKCQVTAGWLDVKPVIGAKSLFNQILSNWNAPATQQYGP